MDPEEIQRLVNQLKLSEEADDSTVALSASLTNNLRLQTKLCLVGKVFASKQVNRELLLTQLPIILQTQLRVDVEIVGPNLFIAQFTSGLDKKHAFLDGPWHFFQDLLLFAEIEGFQHPCEVKFESFTGWIQCHNLPLACMHPDVIRRIGEQIGTVKEIDLGAGGLCLGKFARVRVSWSLNLPLKRCVRLLPDGEMEGAIILLLYEKLPNFCFRCGKIGHLLHFCEEASCGDQELKFGMWILAPRAYEARKKTTHNMVYMTGESSQTERRKVVNESSPRLSPSSHKKGDENEDEAASSAQGCFGGNYRNPKHVSSPAISTPDESQNCEKMLIEMTQALVSGRGGQRGNKEGEGEGHRGHKKEEGKVEKMDGVKKGEGEKGEVHKDDTYEGIGGVEVKGKGVATVGEKSGGKKGTPPKMGGWKKRARKEDVSRRGLGGRGGRGGRGMSPSTEGVERGAVGGRGRGGGEPTGQTASEDLGKKRKGDPEFETEVLIPCSKQPRLDNSYILTPTAEAAEQPRRVQ
ncbi:uncharacterized protein LOC130998089 [Salvia miltiorrhiza]|uniref:uncharacterized protein LOC130998089 n=1 Tax=Salvia miltiorrhiza TaxID=226208 RepID=UPI0025AC42B9|nr:uncharacterized protein LOC130998089 [Salvia miltiorrhiza]